MTIVAGIWFLISLALIMGASISVTHAPLVVSQNVLPVQATVRNVIYVRPGGSDVTGDGKTPATAFATVQFALNTIPLVIPTNTRYVVNCDTVNEAGVVRIPPFQSNGGLFNPSPDFLGFYEAPITIQATPKAATGVPLADTIIAAGEIVSQTADAITALETITTTKAWPVNAFQGKYIVSATGTIAAIASNTATTLELCWAFGALTAPLAIVEPNAAMAGPAGVTQETILIDGVDAGVAINGIDLSHTGAYFPAGLGLFACQEFLGNMITASMRFRTGAQIAEFLSAYVRTYLRIESGHQNLFSTYLHMTNTEIGTDGLGGIFNLGGFISDGVTGLAQGSGSIFNVAFQFSNGDIRNAGGAGVLIQGGNSNRNVLSALKSHNNGGDGVAIAGNPGKTVNALSGVRGTANGGFGLSVLGASDFAIVDSTTDITGTSGDFHVGTRPVRTWANFRAVGPAQYIESDIGQNTTNKTEAVLKQSTGATITFERDASGFLQTVDATANQLLASFTPPANSTISVRLVVLAQYNAHTQHLTNTIMAGFKTVAAVVTQLGANANLLAVQDAGFLGTLVFDTDGTVIRVRVTGVAATTINWTARFDYQVSSL